MDAELRLAEAGECSHYGLVPKKRECGYKSFWQTKINLIIEV